MTSEPWMQKSALEHIAQANQLLHEAEQAVPQLPQNFSAKEYVENVDRQAQVHATAYSNL